MGEFIKTLKELLAMTEKLTLWKFLLIWLIGALFGAGYFIKAIVELMR